MKETLEYLYSLRNQGSSYGIERMELLLSKMGGKVLSFPVIHVAGTNGKGSTCAMLDAIYRENGYSVGLFSSPHLVELGERIKVNGKVLPLEDLVRYVKILRPLAEEIEKEQPTMHPSFFELITAVAFYVFDEKKIDIAVLETGLGGRLDSTNIVKPEISLITTVSLDHCHILGDTIEAIAREKAGIIKSRSPVLTGWIPREAEKVMMEKAKISGSEYYTLSGSPKEKNLPETNLAGFHQKRNAALALRAAELIQDKFPLNHQKSRKALCSVKLRGRWETIGNNPHIIIDACHNQEGAVTLEQQIGTLPQNKELVVWFGSLGTDRAKEIISVITKYASEIRFFRPNQPRSCSYEVLASIIPESFVGCVQSGKVSQVDMYLREIGKHQILLVTGSIYLLGEILEAVKNTKKSLGPDFQDLV